MWCGAVVSLARDENYATGEEEEEPAVKAFAVAALEQSDRAALSLCLTMKKSLHFFCIWTFWTSGPLIWHIGRVAGKFEMQLIISRVF